MQHLIITIAIQAHVIHAMQQELVSDIMQHVCHKPTANHSEWTIVPIQLVKCVPQHSHVWKNQIIVQCRVLTLGHPIVWDVANTAQMCKCVFKQMKHAWNQMIASALAMKLNATQNTHVVGATQTSTVM